ncbi:putative E3 ubiquitin-protein ligase LIN-1 [Andrographis paniculata]|uniref:putative E3 ubiquitin-protein ligase LIN-1 n=1 Tax=Andrographis paniculata TaxID=175694 RepID=UPI0021E8E4DB|nr:putative E3 ubiquitin-protein ligase LIN-1 [Andrographis paniculata]
MAMSLEDLLSEEGFRRRSISKIRPRISVALEGGGAARHAAAPPPGRSRSHIPHHDSNAEFSIDDRKIGDDHGKFTAGSSSKEIVEIGSYPKPHKNAYFNKVYSRKVDKTMKQANSFSKMPGVVKQAAQIIEPPALYDVAAKALTSILIEQIKRFIDDEEFRASLRHNSFASLTFVGLIKPENKVVETLQEAIEEVESAAAATENNTSSSKKELKKASLQLSLITGLSSNDDANRESPSRIRNYKKLAACARLYLSVIYALQKKDSAAAKNLLQVFCDSPFHARTSLLPELWDRLFLPNLSHVQRWHDEETRSITKSPIFADVELLQKVYNESLDSGTHKFATYYKDWITNGVEAAPSAPLVKIPSFSIQSTPIEGVREHGYRASPASRVSPKPIVSKKLYAEVFKHSHKSEAPRGEETSASSVRSLDSPAPIDKQLILIADESSTDNVAVNLNRNVKEFDSQASLAGIPKDFLCPLTELLFDNPVTLETGQTFERAAIVNWFDKGFLTCPVTRKPLQCRVAPPTNLILKHVIEKWQDDHFEHLLAILARITNDRNEKIGEDTMIVAILEQFLAVFSEDRKISNARQIISFGGVEFLSRRFNHGSIKEKRCILPLLSSCIEANEGCRIDIARSISATNLFELLHGEDSTLRTNAILLMIELICSNRRVRAKRFLEGLRDEEFVSAMDDLVIHLQTCSPELIPLVAALLLNLSIMSGDTYDIYEHEAVEALTMAMRRSLADEKLSRKCSRALLILGGWFHSSGRVMTEDWILKVAGFLDCPDSDNTGNNDDAMSEEEETERNNWLVSITRALLGDNGRRLFIDGVSECLSFGNSDMARVCLTTAAWLSSSVAVLHGKEAKIRAFSTLISPLKESLQYGELVEHKILASLCLFNFSKIPECRTEMVKLGEEIRPFLEDLAEVTWTAKELNLIVSEIWV